ARGRSALPASRRSSGYFWSPHLRSDASHTRQHFPTEQLDRVFDVLGWILAGAEDDVDDTDSGCCVELLDLLHYRVRRSAEQHTSRTKRHRARIRSVSIARTARRPERVSWTGYRAPQQESQRCWQEDRLHFG